MGDYSGFNSSDLEIWIEQNKNKFDSEFEIAFLRNVLPLVKRISLDMLSAKYQFKDLEGKLRYCDFFISFLERHIAIEIDGYDKRGTGQGMTHAEFIDWQRRQAALAAKGWFVLRFANKDVISNSEFCANVINKLLDEISLNCNKWGLIVGSEKVAFLQEKLCDFDCELSGDSSDVINEDSNKQEKKVVLNRNIPYFIWGILFALFIIFGYLFFEKKPIQPIQNLSEKVEVEKNIGCSYGVDWSSAKNYIGETISVVGDLKKVAIPQNTKGNPVYIDVGASYPDKKRVSLVIWESYREKFDISLFQEKVSSTICVSGTIYVFDGVIRIELKDPSQVVFN